MRPEFGDRSRRDARRLVTTTDIGAADAVTNKNQRHIVTGSREQAVLIYLAVKQLLMTDVTIVGKLWARLRIDCRSFIDLCARARQATRDSRGGDRPRSPPRPPLNSQGIVPVNWVEIGGDTGALDLDEWCCRGIVRGVSRGQTVQHE